MEPIILSNPGVSGDEVLIGYICYTLWRVFLERDRFRFW